MNTPGGADSPILSHSKIRQQSGKLDLPRDVALSIALAARALPDTEIKDLLKGLIALVGEPLSAAKLKKLNAGSLKQLNFLQDAEASDLDKALSFLTGQGQKIAQGNSEDGGNELHRDSEQALNSLPTIQPPFASEQGAILASHVQQQESDSKQGYIQVACASNTGDLIDGHFGSCSRFLIYQVSPAELRLVDIRSPVKVAGSEEKNAQRAQLLNDCHVLYTVSIGGPAAAKVVRAGLHPIKLPEGGTAPVILDRLRKTIAEAPPPWLAKAMGIAAEKRVRFREENTYD